MFEKGDRPSLVISTLEALALVIALKIRFGQDPDPDETCVIVVPSITDNRGNGAVLNSLCRPSSFLGGAHGAGIIHETTWYESYCRMGAKGMQQGSGHAG